MKINKAARLFWHEHPLPPRPVSEGALARLCLTHGLTPLLGRAPRQPACHREIVLPKDSSEDPRELERHLVLKSG